MRSVALVLLLASSFAEAAPPAPQWSAKMRELQKTLQEILVDTSNDQRYTDRRNFKRIEKNAKTLADLAHDLESKKMSVPDKDPTVRLLAGLFADEADHAYEALKSGHRDYARNVLRSMTSYCMACHSRSSSGPTFNSSAADLLVKDMTAPDRADYYVAVRQFDRALEELEAFIASPSAYSQRPLDWENAVLTSLAITVRVRKDPDHAIRITERVIGTSKAPMFLREQAGLWLKSLKEWKEELPRQPKTVEGLYSEALRLVGKAKEAQQYPADHAGDIYYLRASAVLHELLGLEPQGKRAAEALYLAGVTYEVLQDVNLMELHEAYYQACIAQNPRSPIARTCYRQYEQSVYAGYSGSAGTFIPPDVMQKLQKLEELSRPPGEPNVQGSEKLR